MDGPKYDSTRARLLVTTLCLLIMTPIAMAAPEPRPVDTEHKQAPFWDEPLLPSVGLQLAFEDKAPDQVWAGNEFVVSIRVDNEALSPEFLNILPGLHADSVACSIIGVTVDAGYEVLHTSYLLAGDGDSSLRREISYFDVGDELEPSNAIPMEYVWISILGTTTPGVHGDCLVGVEVKRVVGSGIGVDRVSRFLSIQVVEQPPTPVTLGLLRGEGGPIKVDRVIDDSSDLDDLTPLDVPLVVATLSSEATLYLQALASWDDGPDWGDRGRFYYEVEGDELVGSRVTIAEPATLKDVAHETKVAAGAIGDPRVHTVCYVGEYIDGGLYDSLESRKKRCVEVEVTEVPEIESLDLNVENLTRLVADALNEASLPLAGPAEIGPYLERHGSALIPLGDDAQTHLHLDAATWYRLSPQNAGQP